MKRTIKDILHRTAAAFAVSLAATASVAAQNTLVAPAKITTSIDTSTMTMGERTNFHIEVLKNSHNGALINFEGTDNNLTMNSIVEMLGQKDMHPTLNGIEIRQVDVDSAELGNGRVQVNYTLLLQPFKPDEYSIPAARYVIDGDTLLSNVTTLKVLEPEMPKEMRDSLWINPMRGTLSIESRWYDWIPESWYIWVIALASIALIAAIIMLYRKNGKTLIPIKHRIPPYTLAKNRLEALKKKRLVEQGHTKAYYTELTAILRQYLGGRFHIYALEMTSTQILYAMKQNAETAPYIESLRKMFTVADFVKFAKQSTTPSENIQSFNAVENFVDSTRPIEVIKDDKKKDRTIPSIPGTGAKKNDENSPTLPDSIDKKA